MERKEIIKVLGDHFGVKPKYMGTPSFAYQIETAEETYTVDREGKITTSAGEEVELEVLLGATNTEEVIKPTAFEVAVPMEGHTGITFDFSNKIITFKFFDGEASAEKVEAYTQFVALLNQKAKVLKHASAKAKDTGNDKFTFRVFLIRLGMVGNEYKVARKILLEKVEGNSAFRSGKKPEKVKEVPALQEATE